MGIIPRGTEIWLATDVLLAFLLSFQSPLKWLPWMFLCKDSGPVTLLKPQWSLLNPKPMSACGLETFQGGSRWHSTVIQPTTTGSVFILKGMTDLLFPPPFFACAARQVAARWLTGGVRESAPRPAAGRGVPLSEGRAGLRARQGTPFPAADAVARGR